MGDGRPGGRWSAETAVSPARRRKRANTPLCRRTELKRAGFRVSTACRSRKSTGCSRSPVNIRGIQHTRVDQLPRVFPRREFMGAYATEVAKSTRRNNCCPIDPLNVSSGTNRPACATRRPFTCTSPAATLPTPLRPAGFLTCRRDNVRLRRREKPEAIHPTPDSIRTIHPARARLDSSGEFSLGVIYVLWSWRAPTRSSTPTTAVIPLASAVREALREDRKSESSAGLHEDFKKQSRPLAPSPQGISP
jgi:hypothetical protein